MTKKRVVIMSIIDATSDEVQFLAEKLKSLDLPYHFVVANKDIISFDKDDFMKILMWLANQ